MDRILLVAAIMFLYSSASLATDEERVPAEFQYTLASYHEGGFDETRQTAWIGKNRQFTNRNEILLVGSTNDSRDSNKSVPRTGLGMGVAPLFGSYGVLRTSSNQDNSTYVALGYVLDDLTQDEAAAWDSRDERGFSYGIGINHSSFNVEYMMSVNEEDYGVSAIGLGFTSAF